jgi:hypothetical protein
MQLPANLIDAVRSALEAHNRASADDAQPVGVQTAKLSDELLGKSVGENRFLGIAA